MKIKQSWVLFLKGSLIGMALVIPGVSAGTMALITGLYSSLIHALSSLKISILINRKEFLKNWYTFSYLIPALIGSVFGFYIIIQWMTFFINEYPLQTYCLFSGIILSSIPFLYRQIKISKLGIGLFILFAFLTFCFSFFQSVFFSGYFWLFLSVYLAIGAMFLPGVSGSYILVVMGTYPRIISDVQSL